MRCTALVLLAILSLSLIALGQNDTTKFRYRRSAAIPVGTVLHYLKTNIDGSKPEHVSQYIASANAMESFKFHPKESPAGFVVAEMDWQTFSATTLKSWQVFRSEGRKLFGTIEFDAEARKGAVSIPRLRAEPDHFSFAQLPVHLYNFDLGTLNIALPHLNKPNGNFVIGIVDPTFSQEGPLVEYKGAVTVSYLSDETRDGTRTRKYKIDGAGLNNRGGVIWVDKRRGWIRDMEIELPDNPDWSSFKLKLVKVERMSRSQWETFMASQF